MYQMQRTLKSPIHCSGIGLHSGRKVRISLHPAEVDSGIRFRLTEGKHAGMEIPAHWSCAVESPLCSTLTGPDGARIMTVEHLLSAFAGCGIDNALVEINADEVPVMDGSAAPFVFLIECAGSCDQDKPRRAVKILKDVLVQDGKRAAKLSPCNAYHISFEIDFESQAIRHQAWSNRITEGLFKRDIARARTFGFFEEVDKLREMGLARGGSLDNAIVIDGDEILNKDGLRYEDEFVRHKVLDLIGDLALAGGPILGRFHCVKVGHAMTLRLLQKLFADDSNWTWANLSAEEALTGAGTPAVARAVAGPA
jgi:UDP-3-O-[3-hydroxymyristoyl] N-acetylglucosamine deacetylase